MSVMHSVFNHFYKDCITNDKLDRNNSMKYLCEYVQPKILKDYEKAKRTDDHISYGCTNSHIYLATKLELRIPKGHTRVCDYFFEIVKQELNKKINSPRYSEIKIINRNYSIDILTVE